MNNKHEYVSPLNDIVFSHVFGEQCNIQNTGDFLSSLLDIPTDEYEHLTVKNSVMKPSSVHGKTSIVDILLETKSGRIIQIEMQVEKEPNFRGRILHYAAQIFGRQLGKGHNYSKLHQVISIVICDHVLLDDDDSYFNVFELRNVRNKLFTNLLQVIIIELPKIPDSQDGPLWPWLKFLKCKSLEECEMLVNKHPKLKKAADSVKRFTFAERWEWTMILRERRRREFLTWKEYVLNEAQTEGRAIGLAEGKAESRLEMARKMKDMCLPVEQITELTGLSSNDIQIL